MATTAEGDNLAAVLHGPDDLRVEAIAMPTVADDEVLLSMGAVCICGSDLKYWKHGQCGRYVMTAPMVMGHEASGVVIATGKHVTHLRKGDRVAIEPGVPCRACELCREGQYNLCHEVRFCATPPVDGNIAKFYSHPADFCFKLPDQVSLEEGAMLEPLAVAVYSCERGGVTGGSTVLICGAGPVGILVMMVARALGAASVLVTDIDDGRLRLARSLGADHTLKVSSSDAKEVAEQVRQTLGGGATVGIECSGVDMSLHTCIYAARSGGCVVMVGRGSMCPEVPLVEAATRQVDIKGVFRYANCYPRALALVSSGRVNIKPLITHHYDLIDSSKAFDTAYDRSSGAVKVVIHCDQ